MHLKSHSLQKMNAKIIAYSFAVIVGLVLVDNVACTYFKQVQNKLELFATGRATDSGITREEIINLVLEYENQTPQYKQLLRRGSSPDLLMLHFVILPALRIKSTLSNKPDTFDLFKTSVEKGYKRFWPAYNGRVIDNGKLTIAVRKFSNVWRKLIAGKSLTMKDFKDLDMELRAWRARLFELCEVDDVYAHQRELSSILNLVNSLLHKPLFEDVLPMIGTTSDPQHLANLYFEKLWQRYNIKLVKGEFVKYVYESTHSQP